LARQNLLEVVEMNSKRFFYCTITALILSLFTMSAVAGDNPKARPFKGTLYGEATFLPDNDCDSGFITLASTRGDLSHLGDTLYESSHCTGPVAIGTGSLVAANGDELYFNYYTPTVEVGPIIIQEGTFFITGGTGRFAGAIGEVTGTIYITFEGMADPSWPIEIVFAGTLVY
jgi:hypothetical protein